MDGLILAGGKSSRMGERHKGDLLYGQQTFTQRLVQEISPYVENIWLSYGETVHREYPGCTILKDEFPNCGPMGGLYTGLRHCKGEIMLVAACDMPLLKVGLYSYLESLLKDHDGVIPVFQGQIQPLAALYTKNMLLFLKAALESGNYRLWNVLQQAKICYVDAEQFGPMLQNINTPQEYQALVQCRLVQQ